MSEQEDKLKERGRSLVKDHKNYPELRVIVTTGSEKWLVKSKTKPFPYFVYHDYDSGWNCDCSYNTYKGTCKHIFGIQFALETNVFIPQYDSKLDGGNDLDL